VGNKNKTFQSEIKALPFILPFLAVYVTFLVVPMIQGLWTSFHNWNLVRKIDFIGVANYIKMFKDEHFWASLGHTAFFVIFSTPILIIAGLLLALICTQKSRLITFYRTAFFMPYVLSVAVISLIARFFFQPYNGFINQLIHNLGIKAEPFWLAYAPLAWITITIATLWWTVGFNMILYISALQDIPDSYYEAASLDGATKWQAFIKITIPSLKPVTLLITMLQIISSFKVFLQIYLLNRGGPGTETRPIIMYIYQQGFTANKLGYASAMSYALLVIMIIIAVVQFNVTKQEEGV